MNFGDIFVPALMVFILCYGLVKKVDIVNVFCEGATENLKIAVGLIPMLILLMTAVGMFTSSGAADIIAKLLRPVTTFLGISRRVHTPCHSQTHFRERRTRLP